MAISQVLNRRPWLSPPLLVISGVLCYANSLQGAFYFDDGTVIVHNDALRTFPWRQWLASFRGLVDFSFALNRAAGGIEPYGYHLVNVTIHVLCGLVLYGLVWRTLAAPRLATRYAREAKSLATAVAMIWLVHPLTTQAVTYVCQRYESAAALWYLLGLYCFRRGADEPARRTRWWVGVVLSFAIGLRTKETMITLPLVLACYDRAFVGGAWRDLMQRKMLYGNLLLVGAILAGSEILNDLAIVGEQTLSRAVPVGDGRATLEVANLTPLSYLASQPAVILHYLRLTLVPVGQCFDYGWQSPKTARETIGPAAVIIGFLLATVWALWRRPAFGFFGAAFFLVLAPSSSIIPIQDLAAEHRMYLPLAIVVTLMVMLGYEALRRCLEEQGISAGLRRTMQVAGPGLIAVAALALGSETVARNRLYCFPLEFSIESCNCSPRFWRPHFQLSKALFENGDIAESLIELSATLELEARIADVWQTRGMVWVRAGQLDRAWADFSQSIALDPAFAVAYYNRAMVEMDQHAYESALVDFNRAIQLAPSPYVRAYLARGDVYGRLGNRELAVQNYSLALKFDPFCAEAAERLVKWNASPFGDLENNPPGESGPGVD